MNESRKNKFSPNISSNDIRDNRYKKNFTLRKAKIDDFINSKRFNPPNLDKIIENENSDEEALYYNQIIKEHFDVELIDHYCSLLTGDKFRVIQGLVGIRKCLSDPRCFSEFDIKYETALIFLNLLKKSSKFIILYETLWIIVNLISKNTKYSIFFINNQILQLLTPLFTDVTDISIKEQLVWLIANLAGEQNICFRTEMLELNFLNFLVEVLADKSSKGIRWQILWAISNILRGYVNLQKYSTIINILIGELRKLLNSTKLIEIQPVEKVELSYIWYIISELTKSCPFSHKNLIEQNFSNDIIQTLIFYKNNKDEKKIFFQMLQVAGDFSYFSDESTSQIVSKGILIILRDILYNNPSATLQKEVCFILSNILSEQKVYFELFLRVEEFLNLIFNIFDSGATKEVRKEAFWCVATFTSYLSEDFLMTLIKFKAIKIYSNWLDDKNPKIGRVALEALENILKFVYENHVDSKIVKLLELEILKYNISDKLIKLELNKNDIISSLAKSLNNQYFNDDGYEMNESISNDDNTDTCRSVNIKIDFSQENKEDIFNSQEFFIQNKNNSFFEDSDSLFFNN